MSGKEQLRILLWACWGAIGGAVYGAWRIASIGVTLDMVPAAALIDAVAKPAIFGVIAGIVIGLLFVIASRPAKN